MSKGRQTFYSLDVEENPFAASVYLTEMNANGKEALFVLFGNSYTYGVAGTNIILYIPGKSGQL